MFQLRLGDATTVRFSIPITAEPGVVCESAIGISPEGLQTLASGGSVVLGGMSLARVLGSVKAGSAS